MQAIDGELAGDRDGPTIGILICAGRNETVVRYAVQGMASPIAVSRFDLGPGPAGLSPEVLDTLPTEDALLKLAEGIQSARPS